MCGICGSIGVSTNPAASYELLTQLFEKAETRGEDASGVWATEPGANGRILYHKEPVKAREFVKEDMWKKVKKLAPDLVLLHARAASFGVGSPKINKNNHPFVSADKTRALIHNGRVPDIEYQFLKKQYEVKSECDSEMILRVFEHGKDSLDGIRNIWSYMHRSHMAVAIGERINAERKLWLFRNDQRPIWITDMRHNLGQVFFFSDPDIWDEAICTSKHSWKYLNKVKLIELSTEVLWCLTIENNEVVLNKYQISLKENMPWKSNGEKFQIKEPNFEVEVISSLDKDEEVEGGTQNADMGVLGGSPPWKHKYLEEIPGDELFVEQTDSKKNADKLSEQHSKITQLLSDIEVVAENRILEGTMDTDEYNALLTSLEEVELELKGTLSILDIRRA